MGKARDVVCIVGSLRKESFNRKLALAFGKLVQPGLALDLVDLRPLAMYDQDLDAAPPAPWVTFRDRIRRADAVLFVTPEYNRSVPGVLKNAIDVGSRPYGQSAWDGKPCAVMSSTPGALGAFGANHHLRQSLVFLNMPVLQQPEIYIGNVATLLDDKGGLTNEKTVALLTKFGSAFSAWIDRHAPN